MGVSERKVAVNDLRWAIEMRPSLNGKTKDAAELKGGQHDLNQ